MMNLNLFIFIAPVLTGIVLFLSLSVYFSTRRNPKYAVSRLFLNKRETLSAIKYIMVGMIILAINRVIHIGYSFNLVSYNVYFISGATLGLGTDLCLM
ncbi:MAG TPA: hypothetical protein ENF80_01415, partial [Thermofilum sp.]|nr:hypothetical protein [Thermofilum sp.]